MTASKGWNCSTRSSTSTSRRSAARRAPIPATYTDLFAPIRDWFAELPEVRARGYKPGRFSFNVKGGRCEACQGDGVLKIEMHFLPDVYVTCDVCKGKRYNRETLEIKFRDKSIAEVLAMTVDEAVPYFSAQTRIHDRLQHPPAGRARLHRARPAGDHAVGRRGAADQAVEGTGAARDRAHAVYPRRADDGSAFRGRAQAAGGAARAGRSGQHGGGCHGPHVVHLDEPTTGLHFEDVRKLLEVLHALVDQGNTVVVIEHNLEVIKTADWILDLGPEGGDGGGRIVAEGTPEDIAAHPDSHTGRFLSPLLMRATTRQKARRRA